MAYATQFRNKLISDIIDNKSIFDAVVFICYWNI